MTILIDRPRWPAHGTLFGHLVSDASLTELHAFAEANAIPIQAFDHDHYDVEQSRFGSLIAAGAILVGERELARRLAASGLRVRAADKGPTRASAFEFLTARWNGLALPASLGADLLSRWAEPHRHYHDTRHLTQCLGALDLLGGGDRTVELAAWFHDAIYLGRAGLDEEESAELATDSLTGLLPPREVLDVAALIQMTISHRPNDPRAALLCDADLSILGQAPGRYHVYVRDVRLDYAHVPDDQWRTGRIRVLDELLGLDPLFHTELARRLWASQARANLAEERTRWDGSATT